MRKKGFKLRKVSARAGFSELEAVAGFYFAGLIGLGFITFACSPVWLAKGWVLGPEWFLRLMVIAGELLFLSKLNEALGPTDSAFAPQFAYRAGNWLAPIRALMALWWLAHFVAAIGFAFFLERVVYEKSEDWVFEVKQTAIAVGMNFAAAYSANLYLLIAMGAAGASRELIRRAWRWRFIIDLGLAVAAIAAPKFL